MPRAKAICSERACPRIASTKGRCDEHATLHRGRYDAQRGTSAQRGYGARHREWRTRVLQAEPMCRMCQAEFATVADHITPIRMGGSRFDVSNGQGLCHGCHNRKTAQDGSR